MIVFFPVVFSYTCFALFRDQGDTPTLQLNCHGFSFVFVLSSCEVLENTGKAKVSINYKNVQKSNQAFFSDDKAEMLTFIENFVAVSSFRFGLHCVPLKDEI